MHHSPLLSQSRVPCDAKCYFLNGPIRACSWNTWEPGTPKWCSCQAFLNFAGYTDRSLHSAACSVAEPGGEAGRESYPGTSLLFHCNPWMVWQLGPNLPGLFRVMVTRTRCHSACFMPWPGVTAMWVHFLLCWNRSGSVQACGNESSQPSYW